MDIELLRSIIDFLPFPIYLIEAESYSVLLTNQATLKSKVLNSIPCFTLLHKLEEPCCEPDRPCPLAEARKTKVPSKTEHSYLDRSGRRRVLDVWAFPLVDKNSRLTHVLTMAMDVTEKKGTEHGLKIATDILRAERQTLHEKGIALHEILEQVELSKEKVVRQIKDDVDRTVFPLIRKLESGACTTDRQYFHVLADNLSRAFSSRSRQSAGSPPNLTPREMEICALVERGMSIKEIASTMNTAEATVQKHRKNIRRKLGISRRKVNLTKFLRS